MISRSLVKPFTHVWSKDPAIDRTSPSFSWAEYERTGDLKFLPCVEGGEFTVFHLQVLSRRQLQACLAAIGQGDAYNGFVEAAAFALVKVDRFGLVDGSFLEVQRQQIENGEKRCTRGTIDAIGDVDLLVELGSRAIAQSKLNPTRGQG